MLFPFYLLLNSLRRMRVSTCFVLYVKSLLSIQLKYPGSRFSTSDTLHPLYLPKLKTSCILGLPSASVSILPFASFISFHIMRPAKSTLLLSLENSASSFMSLFNWRSGSSCFPGAYMSSSPCSTLYVASVS